MRLTRIFVRQTLTTGAKIELPAEAAHHVSRVLRMNVGAPLCVFNGDGSEYRAEISQITGNTVNVRLDEVAPGVPTSPLRVTLVQGISRGERMDWTLQKATELGVHRIVPVLTSRSVVRLDDKQSSRKGDHWVSVVRSACEQCGRCEVPDVTPAGTLREYLLSSEPRGLRLVLDPAAPNALTGLSGVPNDIELLIGPEGGLDDEELSAARKAGFSAVRLGPRILRTETAAVAALAVMQALWGDLS